MSNRLQSSETMSLESALALVKAAGFKVSKPKARASKKDRVGPTFVATFADGQVTRMSTYTSLEKLDVERGRRLAVYAWESRRRSRISPALRDAVLRMQYSSIMNRERLAAFCEEYHNRPAPAIVSAHFEQDGITLATF